MSQVMHALYAVKSLEHFGPAPEDWPLIKKIKLALAGKSLYDELSGTELDLYQQIEEAKDKAYQRLPPRKPLTQEDYERMDAARKGKLRRGGFHPDFGR